MLFNRHGVSNELPYDGTVIYYGSIMTTKEADNYLQQLSKKIEWRNDEVIIFGKHFITNRKVAWYGDEPYLYTYSNSRKLAMAWTPELASLKKIVEASSRETFNSCLLNLYHDGSQGMGWHSDDERSLKKNGAIASLSLGAERKFTFKHKVTKETTSIMLQHGSLLIMKDNTQANWLHSLPKSKKVIDPRVNLTFRTFIG